MYYQSELHFLRDVFYKSNVNTTLSGMFEIEENLKEITYEHVFDRYYSITEALITLIKSMKPNTVYKLTDSFERKYICLLLPASDEPIVFFVGPYLSEEMSNQNYLMICEKNGIPPQKQQKINDYFYSLPIIDASSPLMTMFNTFCEILWKKPSFSIVDIVGKRKTPDLTISKSMQTSSTEEQFDMIKEMEKRYAYENRMIEAVSLGQVHAENQLFSAFSGNLFEKRVADPLRNSKNYCIIMNTLLRKAAERGGVHPIHLDRISSEYASKIENLSSVYENHELMSEMFRNYCKLVQKHSIKKYSLVVQNAILIIDSDLSADISPSTLAKRLDTSLGYLSSSFSKETGKTLSEYIREKRMNYAAHLLSTTDLQVQTVALHCGIMDAQYFSKLFKKSSGLSPNEYRAYAKKH